MAEAVALTSLSHGAGCGCKLPAAALLPIVRGLPRAEDPRVRGYSYKSIAARLGISARTVESHVGAVLRKLRLSSRREVSHWAAARGLLDPGAP